MKPPMKYSDEPGTFVIRWPINPPVQDSARDSFKPRWCNIFPASISTKRFDKVTTPICLVSSKQDYTRETNKKVSSQVVGDLCETDVDYGIMPWLYVSRITGTIREIAPATTAATQQKMTNPGSNREPAACPQPNWLTPFTAITSSTST